MPLLGAALLFWNRNFTSGGWVDGWVWSSPQKVVHLLVWGINPIRNLSFASFCSIYGVMGTTAPCKTTPLISGLVG